MPDIIKDDINNLDEAYLTKSMKLFVNMNFRPIIGVSYTKSELHRYQLSCITMRVSWGRWKKECAGYEKRL